MVAGNENDAGIRRALIAAARAQSNRGDGSQIDVDEVCAQAGVERSEFERLFSGQEELFAAVLQEDVAQKIAEATVTPSVPAAVAQAAPHSAAGSQADAWLERRLRVFERALAGLEARQEKTEQLLNRSVALLEEKQPRTSERRASRRAEPASMPTQEALGSQEEMEPQVAVASFKPRPLPLPELEPEPAITPEEMEGLLQNARRAAREAAVVDPSEPRSRRIPVWMAWTALGCVVLMALTGLTVANLLNTSSARADNVSHRQIAQLSPMVLADNGDPRNQTKLALAYLEGRGGPPDKAAALRFGLAAANRGDPMAQYLIATLYQDGTGVAADPHRAFTWFEAAALRGNLKAMHDLAIAYDEGAGTPQDPSRAAAWFNRAAEQGYVDSQFDLAVLYERGDGVRQNPGSALKWYFIAAKAGDAQAKIRADQLAREIPAEDVARAEALAGAFKPVPRDALANTL